MQRRDVLKMIPLSIAGMTELPRMGQGGRIIARHPLARFHLRLGFEVQPDDWWMKAYPGECEITSEGKPFGQSFASEVWRKQVKDFLEAFIAHLNRCGLMDRVTAFQTGAGHTGEWVKGETSMSALCGDYSEPMRQHFRSWLRQQYNNDLSAFRAAWNNPHLSFDAAEVPSAEEQLQTKLYIFLNSFQLDKTRREALNRELRKDGRVAVWIYAPGQIEDGPSLEHMRELTGFTFSMGEQPWGPLMHLVDFAHPITAGLPQDLSWGTNSKLSPIFYLDDPDAHLLGQVVFSQGNCKPGMGVKAFPAWTSIYVAAPNLPAPVLRGIARFAGVHLYNREGDVLYATRELLAVHTVSGGNRTFSLPRAVEEVYDLFERKSVARNSKEFRVTLQPVSSALFYTGGAALLSSYSSKRATALA